MKYILCCFLIVTSTNLKTFGEIKTENKEMKTWVTNSGYKIIQVLSGRSNVFLITNDVINILIDTGPINKQDKLESILANLKINHIDYLILTHTHFDHVGNAAFIKNKYNAQVIVHESEYDYLKTGYSPLPKGSIFPTRLLINLANRFHLRFLYEPCIGDIQVKDTFNFYNHEFNAYIIYTPGHSIGSMSIIIDNKIAIVGDAMFGVFKNSIYPPFSDDIRQMIKSWKLLLETNCLLFFPSHGSSKSRLSVQNDYEKRSK